MLTLVFVHYLNVRIKLVFSEPSHVQSLSVLSRSFYPLSSVVFQTDIHLFYLFHTRISRLFSDAKKILLYSQNDKNLDGFKELAQALQALQNSQSGKKQ